MGKKKNRKQYKQKVTTDKRVDMRTGGRVKAQRGGKQELKNITNYTPMPKKPTPQKTCNRKTSTTTFCTSCAS